MNTLLYWDITFCFIIFEVTGRKLTFPHAAGHGRPQRASGWAWQLWLKPQKMRTTKSIELPVLSLKMRTTQSKPDFELPVLYCLWMLRPPWNDCSFSSLEERGNVCCEGMVLKFSGTPQSVYLQMQHKFKVAILWKLYNIISCFTFHMSRRIISRFPGCKIPLRNTCNGIKVEDCKTILHIVRCVRTYTSSQLSANL